ncbi:MAG: dipeptide/oligopeptide/nickel ABC transporter permease/ATP-binding protein [Proteobacteria bacterium]|nr:dipeptide/oligopeptide/nickel ABC transporter permease/ATP-binding protein [Pseudomonadota bacterium]
MTAPNGESLHGKQNPDPAAPNDELLPQPVGGTAAPLAKVTLGRIMRGFRRDNITLLALIFLFLVVMSALFAEFLAPYSPTQQNLRLRLMPPFTPAVEGGFPHLLGTDALGRDIFSRLIHGARISISLGVASVLLSGTLGVTLGLLGGYYRGRLDDFLSRVVDVQIGFPVLLFALFLLFVTGPGYWNVVVVLALARWPVYARVVRSLTLSYRETPFVEGARAIGCDDRRIILKHLLPNMLSPILVLATLEVSGTILGESGLSFLGLGVTADTPTWGKDVANGREYLRIGWWVIAFPGLTIFLTALSINLAAMWGRTITDPLGRWQWLGVSPVLAKAPPAIAAPSRENVATLTAAPADASTQPRAGNPPVLEVKDLRVEFDTPAGVLYAVNGISYTVEAGQRLVILGESGSGKTVNVETIMGVVPSPPARLSGAIYYRGDNLLTYSPGQRRPLLGSKIAMIFQDPLTALNPAFTVGEQIAEMFRVHQGLSHGQAKKQAIEMMDRMRIPSAARRANDYPHQFSGGMRQRVMIAMALALGPEVLIADEPTTALDVTIQAQIMKLLREVQTETGMALILITHDFGVAVEMADQVLLMYAGKIVERGSIQDIFRQTAHPYTKALLTSIPRADHKGGRLTAIAGAPPRLTHIPFGCPFHPRCPYAIPRCESEVPPLRPVSANHSSACHLFEEVLLDR